MATSSYLLHCRRRRHLPNPKRATQNVLVKWSFTRPASILPRSATKICRRLVTAVRSGLNCGMVPVVAAACSNRPAGKVHRSVEGCGWLFSRAAGRTPFACPALNPSTGCQVPAQPSGWQSPVEGCGWSFSGTSRRTPLQRVLSTRGVQRPVCCSCCCLCATNVLNL